MWSVDTHQMKSRAGIVLLLSLLLWSIAGAASAGRAEEEEFLQLINAARDAEGLESLDLAAGLVDEARHHTAEMIEAGSVFQSGKGELAGYADGEWDLLGESAGYGPDSRLVHDAFIRSDTHRANILGDFDAAAVGATRAGDGTLFVTVLFIKRSEDATEPASIEIPDSVRSVVLFPNAMIERAYSLAASRLTVGPDRQTCGLASGTGIVCID